VRLKLLLLFFGSHLGFSFCVFVCCILDTSKETELYQRRGSFICLESVGLELELAGLELELAGLELESAGLEVESAGLELESAGVELESAGLELESAGLELESAGLELESADLEVESAGLELESADLEVESAGLEVESAGLEVESTSLGAAGGSAGLTSTLSVGLELLLASAVLLASIICFMTLNSASCLDFSIFLVPSEVLSGRHSRGILLKDISP
jgi:hypothetical protein